MDPLQRTRRRAGRLGLALGLIAVGLFAGPAAPAQASTPTNAYLSVLGSAINANSPKTVVATCNAGDVALGASAQVFGGGGNVVVLRAEPNPLAGTVTVTADENVAVGTNWQVVATAICGTDPGGIQVISAFTGAVVGNGAARADCPPAQKVYGTGYRLVNTFAQVFVGELEPDPALSYVSVTGFANAGFAGAFGVFAFAVCGDPATKMVLEQAFSGIGVVSPKGVSTGPCSTGLVQGVGATVTGGVGDVIIDQFTPDATLTATVAQGRANGGFAQPWWITTYAICAAW